MMVLAGGLVVLDEGPVPKSLVLEDGRIFAVVDEDDRVPAGQRVDCSGATIVPGFIDVHVHGIEGVDTLDGEQAVARIAARLPRYGTTAFSPTAVACRPHELRAFLESVAALQEGDVRAAARVLPAHLESNFINPRYAGAQPVACLKSPGAALSDRTREPATGEFTAQEILLEIERAGAAVGTVTLAPELDGARALIRHLVRLGRRVSMGHSGATLEEARAAIDEGARGATHLFNRMPPLDHRHPGLAGAVLTSDAVAAELICDGVHVHHDMVRLAVAAKGPSKVMAITDAVAAAGLPDGAAARIGGRTITSRGSAAYLDDGTLAGSVATMDAVFRRLVHTIGLSLRDAAQLCSTTPARELGTPGLGYIAPGAAADLVVLDAGLNVVRTFIGGRQLFSAVD